MPEPIKPVEEVISQWLIIAIERFQEALKKNKVGVTDKLFKSFLSNVIRSSGGQVSRIEIEFLFYGRYVDMGVGKGFPIGGHKSFRDFSRYRDARGRLLKMGRKPKKWYSKTKTFEIGKLTTLLAEQYGLQTAKAVESALDNQKIIIEI
jgi:hypothetical protein